MLLDCIKDYVMEDGETAFVASAAYEFFPRNSGDFWWCRDEQDTIHEMHISHLLCGCFIYKE